MKPFVLFTISLKYLWRYKRRYLFLFLALGFGFAVLTAISSLKDGIKENLYLSAQSHYAGDIIALGYNPDSGIGWHLTKKEQNAILDAAETSALSPSSFVFRTSLQSMDEGTIFYNGNSLGLKNVVGIDWENEQAYFEQLSFAGEPSPFEENSIVLSLPIARELGIRQGDSVTLEVLTATGQKNTGTLVVSGIIENSDFFSYYKVYVPRITLNRMIGFADGDCSLIGFYIDDRGTIESKRKNLYDLLKERTRTVPLIQDREVFRNERNNAQSGISVFLLTLPVYLSEVAELINAVDLASYVLFVMMLAIIMVSAAVTCRLILHERIKETGTMRAIGFYEADVRNVFRLEIASMACAAMTAGFVVGLLINVSLSYSSFSWFPGFEVFMQNGRLAARYLPGTIIVNIVITGCALALAIGVPIFRNSRNPLPEMLSGGAV